MKTPIQLIFVSAFALLSGCSEADQANAAVTSSPTAEVATAASDLKSQVEQSLKSAFGQQLVVRDAESLAGGQILEVTLTDGSVLHMTPDLKHLIYRDELYRLDGKNTASITQERQNPRRAASLAAVADKDTVVFPAIGKQKALINVFTDIDCGYCQKLHQEVPRLNELGITVRYLAYPRSGIRDQQGSYTESYLKINHVWCQDDRKAAMTEMKNAQRELGAVSRQLRSGDASVQQRFAELQGVVRAGLSDSRDCGAPIEAEYRLGAEVGVTGTPAIVVEDGRLFPGYLPADELAARIGVI
jgi:thiol:disulfide interchange protein DsbC